MNYNKLWEKKKYFDEIKRLNEANEKEISKIKSQLTSLSEEGINNLKKELEEGMNEKDKVTTTTTTQP